MSDLRNISDEKLDRLVGIISNPGYIPTVAVQGCPRVKQLIEASNAVWAEVIRRGDNAIRFEPLPGERSPFEEGGQ